jgi:hypothetical protein
MRDNDLLNTAALRGLPLDRAKFSQGSMFAPLFEAARHALRSEELLPRFGGGYTAGARAWLARTQELRELLDSRQLGRLFGVDGEAAWLSGDISQDRTPELCSYVMCELGIVEVTPDTILSRLDARFLEAQPDAWILRLYEFLNGQPALRARASTLSLIRLTDGTRVPAQVNGQPQAFLPGAIETGFASVPTAVCRSEPARAFLRSIGLTEPDPVDDVIWNILPKYRENGVDVGDDAY